MMRDAVIFAIDLEITGFGKQLIEPQFHGPRPTRGLIQGTDR
jgi:hypothetical protein